MASSESIACPHCGARTPRSQSHRCSSCGRRSSTPGREEDADRRYQQEGFSGLWCGVSLAIVGVLTAAVVLGLPMVVPVFDFEGSAGMMLAIPVWFAAGILVGLVSPARTVLEPSVATFLVAMPTAFLLFRGQTVKELPAFMYVLLSALGVLFATIGSYLGERIQLGPAPSPPRD